ncbi:MAG: molecular chaperone HtpG [Rhizobiales bacterium NRL2]|jgi:molecular chaperone HtpG|nr:MAG: molecular chaperone HtpG [Rhizobiales bacterium NRL2]
MTAENFQFQAEVTRLLHIVTNALYSEKEIFLRELISNASDACERLRYLAIAEPSLTEGAEPFRIRIAVDREAGTLTVCDNGVGMTRDELIENLGTIAKSGSTAFLEQLEGGKSADLSVIGQFGVGFYSAFMVADGVEVLTRRAGEDTAWRWKSDGSGAYTIEDAERAGHGSDVTLKIAEAQKEFLDPDRLRRIVETYSDHIAWPITIHAGGDEMADDADEPVNKASAIWTRPKSEITEQDYTEFYHHVGGGFDAPWLTIHAHVEGKVEYRLLLFVPSERPFDLFHPDRKHRVKLYVKRVFITDEAEELAPSYMRFLRGVVDSEDLPLNVSREMLQNEPLLRHMRGQIVKRVLTELERKAKNDPEGFAKFWETFGAVLKEGIYEDQEVGERILELSRFHSTAGEGLVGLDEYVARMKPEQEAIYYITAEDLEQARKSPQLEGFRAKGVEVLLLTDPVDDFWLSVRPAYNEKPFRSVTRGGADLSKIAGGETETSEEEDKADKPGQTELATLIAGIKQALGEKVKDVRESGRLQESPVCLVADEFDMDLRLERVLKAHKQVDQASKRIMEINPRHPLIRRLAERIREGGVDDALTEASELLLDQALIIEGEPIADPAAFSRRMADFMVRGL